jgi:2',3'-cyclic-nucleotide 2'-phosphodiesterase (5'-nucleotidase family)
VEDLIAKSWQAIEQEQNEIVGHTTVDLLRITEADTGNEFAFGNLVADAMLATEAPSGWEPDVALINSNSIRNSISTGDISRYQLGMAFPFPNQLVFLTLSGEQLQAILEASTDQISIAGMRYVHDPEDRSKIHQIFIGNSLLDPSSSYEVVTIDYLAEGGVGWDTVMNDIASSDKVQEGTLLHALIQYLQDNSPVTPTVEGRITADSEVYGLENNETVEPTEQLHSDVANQETVEPSDVANQEPNKAKPAQPSGQSGSCVGGLVILVPLLIIGLQRRKW